MPWAREEPLDDAARRERLDRFATEFREGRDWVYGIFDPSETRVLGGTGLHARSGPGVLEIGYWIHTEHTSQGLGSEATAALTHVGFVHHGVDRIEIRCDPANVRSRAIPRKLGYVDEITLRANTTTPDGRPRDTMVWAMTAESYPRSAAARYVVRVSSNDVA